MDKIKFYKAAQRRLIKLSVFILLVGVCAIFFFSARRVKEPLVAYSLMEYLKDVKPESVLFECLDSSFIPQETPKDWQNDTLSKPNADFTYFKYYPKYQALLNTKTFLPIEMHLFRDNQEVPFVEPELFNQPNLSWSYVVDKRNRLHLIDASRMTADQDKISEKTEEGLMFWKKGSIHQALELQEGYKEFSVLAANASNFESAGTLDPHMVVYLDDASIGSVFVRSKDLSSYNFNLYTSEGWHKFTIEFDNAYYNEKRNMDSNLLIKSIEVFELLGGVRLGIKKGLEQRFFPGNYALSYFRSLPLENKNKLIRFFKSRFNVDDMRNLILGGYAIQTLIQDVEIGGLIKKAIFSPAPTKLKLKLKVPQDGIKLIFGFGVMEEAWGKPGDGVEFRVRLDTKEQEPEDVLFAQYLNPKANDKDKRWFNAEVDLKRFKGEQIQLIFETRGSMQSPLMTETDESYDWAVWSE